MIFCSQSLLICRSTHGIVMVTTCTCTMIYGSKVKPDNLSSTGKNFLTKFSIFDQKIIIICLNLNVSCIDDQRLDVGDGKELNLEKCSRQHLNRQCIKYLAPVSHVIRLFSFFFNKKCSFFSWANLFCFKQNEREQYEVIVEDGKLVFRQSGILLETTEGSKWIFVLSTSRNLYVGQKKKGLFQHSSFLAGGATTAAGRLVAHGGVLEVRVLKGYF